MKLTERLAHTPVKRRMRFVYAHLEELEELTIRELIRVGTLLCQASSAEMRQQYPISGERYPTEQEKFEVGAFGDADTGTAPGNYVQLPEDSLEDEDDEA